MYNYKDAVSGTDRFNGGIHFWRLKQYLYSVKDAEQRIHILENRINYREDLLDQGNISASEDAEVLNDLRCKCERAERDLCRRRIEVTDFIGQLESSSQQLVLTKRYIQHKTWEQIALELDMGVRLVQKLHGQALIALDSLMPEAA